MPFIGINVYDILNHDTICLTKDCVDYLHSRLLSTAGSARQRHLAAISFDAKQGEQSAEK